MKSLPWLSACVIASRILAFALLTVLLAKWTVPLSASQDPLQTRESLAAWRADASVTVAAAADHVHDDDPGDGSRHGHQHGHSAADHTHDNPMTLQRQGANAPLGRDNAWQPRPGWWGDSADLSPLEKPPKMALSETPAAGPWPALVNPLRSLQ